MSRLIDVRSRIETALSDAGIRVGIGQRFTAPGVIIEPSDPWAERSHLAGCLKSRWRLWAAAPAGDTKAGYAALGELVDAIDLALKPIQGLSHPTWSGPQDRDIGGVLYPASLAEVEIDTAKLGGI